MDRAADMAERTCIVTREVRNSVRLIRFVAGPDGSVIPDLRRKLPGRGVWVTARRDYVETAVAKSAFAHGLKTNAKADSDLPARVDTLLAEAALGALGLARKTGQCVTGSGKVDDAIRAGKAIGVLHATDGSKDGLRKTRQAVKAASKGDATVPSWRVFTTGEMSLVLGMPHVVHAALTEGGAARKCAHSIAALAAYRGGETNDTEPL